MAKAANVANKFWRVSSGVQTFQASVAYGVLNQDGTHALGRKGEVSSWGTKKTASTIAEYADDLVAGGANEWIRVFDAKRCK